MCCCHLSSRDSFFVATKAPVCEPEDDCMAAVGCSKIMSQLHTGAAFFGAFAACKSFGLPPWFAKSQQQNVPRCSFRDEADHSNYEQMLEVRLQILQRRAMLQPQQTEPGESCKTFSCRCLESSTTKTKKTLKSSTAKHSAAPRQE